MAVPALTRRRRSAPWRRWFPILICLGLLALAPILAHADEADSVVVTWTAPGDDGRVGTAVAYDLRMSTTELTGASFEAATPVPGVPAPAAAGTRQHVTVHGVTRGTTYYFAIRTVDDQNNWSGVSNVLRWDWIVDTAPPGTPSGLAAQREAANIQLTWSQNADADLAGYTVYRAQSATGPYVVINGTLLSEPAFVDTAVPAEAEALWYQVTAWDAAGNESGRSAAVQVVLISPPPPPPTTTEPTIEPGYPNPSHADSPVQIPIVLLGSAPAVIDVVDSGGHRVRRLDLSGLGAGRQQVSWDGKNDAGRIVAPGAYRAWLIEGDHRSSIRLVRVP